MTNVSNFQILAANDALSSENRIHSDEIAKKYGFQGALVSGANIFGYLSQPLVRHYQEDWLQIGIMDVAFIKPAYQDNLLTITTKNIRSNSDQRNHRTSAYNDNNLLLAKLESWQPANLPSVSELAQNFREPEQIKRKEIRWGLIEINTPWPTYLWQPKIEDNLKRVQSQRDQSEIYLGGEGYIHPYYLLEACNKSLMRQFILPAWIHTGSRLILRKPVKVGQNIEIRAVPMDKWEHKGHQFLKLYIAMLTHNVTALEVEHTAIFKIAH